MRETLRLGGIAIAIECDDPAIDCRVVGLERLFVTDDDVTPDFTVSVSRLHQYAPPRGDCLFDSGLVWSLHRDGDASRIECRSPLFGPNPYKIAVIDEAFRHAEVFVTDGANPLEFPLGELLFNALLTRRGGIELHACGIIDNGQGLVFIGNSGHGKTTTARLWQASSDVEIVSDDRVILRPHDGTWWMYGTPWHGEAEICSPSRAPLSRIFTLSKGTTNQLTPLSPAEGAARLLTCAFPPFHDLEGMQTVTGIVASLATQVPIARYSFLNEPSAVEFIRTLPGARAA
jgi:hypothetical protein